MEGRPGPGLSQGGRFCLKSRKNILALARGLKMQRSVLWRIIQTCIHTAAPALGQRPQQLNRQKLVRRCKAFPRWGQGALQPLDLGFGTRQPCCSRSSFSCFHSFFSYFGLSGFARMPLPPRSHVLEGPDCPCRPWTCLLRLGSWGLSGAFAWMRPSAGTGRL